MIAGVRQQSRGVLGEGPKRRLKRITKCPGCGKEVDAATLVKGAANSHKCSSPEQKPASVNAALNHRRPPDRPSTPSPGPAKIYASIKSRAYGRALIAGRKGAGLRMLEAAKRFYERPSEAALKEFANAEIAWSKLSDQYVKCYADELHIALKERAHFSVPEPNGHWKEGPNFGFIYGLWSKQRPGWVKIGVTSRHPTDRQEELKKRHALEHLEILFFYEVAKPQMVEHEFHIRFGTRISQAGKRDSREWFEFAAAKAHEEVLAIVSFFNLKRMPTHYVNRKALAPPVAPISPTGDFTPGGRRARPVR